MFRCSFGLPAFPITLSSRDPRTASCQQLYDCCHGRSDRDPIVDQNDPGACQTQRVVSRGGGMCATADAGTNGTTMSCTASGASCVCVDYARLTACPAMSIPISMCPTTNEISLLLHSVHFGGRITATTITSGQLGAHLLVSDLAVCRTLCIGDQTSAIESFVHPDLMPDATGAHCAAVSAGFGYTAIAATLP